MPSPSGRVTVRGSAKINLFLDVRGPREDGYHEIETLMQPIGLWDELCLIRIGSGIELVGDDEGIPWDSRNLCYRAAEAILAGTGGGVRISVEKGIPHGGGLGGGSSDAAATLIGLNELFGLGRTEDELACMGLSLGSDVPFFIRGGPAVGRGRGEILEPVEGLQTGWILVVKPSAAVSTSWAYRNLKIGLTRDRGADTLGRLIEGLKRFPEAELTTWNSFTRTVIERYPEIGEILDTLRSSGATLSAMSGSGSACFAIYGDQRRAAEVQSLFNGRGLFTWIVRPVDRAVVLLHEE